MNKDSSFIKSFIPKHVPNALVLSTFSMMSLLTGHVGKKVINMHYTDNAKILKESGKSLFDENNFIENQCMWEQVNFGAHKKSNIAYSGCEIIATWNALHALHLDGIKMTELISYYEKNGAALRGGFGIAPAAPAKFFKKKGFKVQRNTSRQNEAINAFGAVYDTYLLTFYWDREDITRQLHTVNISKDDYGFWVHNVYLKNSKGEFIPRGPAKTLSQAVRSLGNRVEPIVIYGIKRI